MLTHRQLATSGIPWSAHVSAIIEGDNWKTREGNLQTIWASLPAYKPDPHKEDQIIWSQHGTDKFSIATAWELIRHHSPAQDTHLLIWQKEHIPRHAFILWLAVQGRLRTRDRISTITAIPSLLCALCNQEPETHDHLFFRCHHSRTVWETVNGHAGFNLALSRVEPTHGTGRSQVTNARRMSPKHDSEARLSRFGLQHPAREE
ncbi:hypothetical protein OIU74_021114 [Salix koriyanagi]|uniref:Reverse transcriptase zinc-binding domain-containing protein n=1 Tax=Salix koriyanagi TaxID=2511006 RepID=A0A9Q0SMZ7_9ROSI|nr:hypothetical protein OIU74_021114 [Salix koriyanagi]